MKIVCSTTENYLPNAENFLHTANAFATCKTVLMTVDFELDSEYFKERKWGNVYWSKITSEENLGAPEGTNSIQHGSFLPFVVGEDAETIIYCDLDIIMQRPMSMAEYIWFSDLKEGTALVGWNSGPKEMLIHEAMRLNPKVTIEEFTSTWGRQIEYEPCFNIGVLIANSETWKKIYDRYMELWPLACGTMGHRARQQWLVCYVMAELSINREILPYYVHTHAHYGLPEGVYKTANGVAGYDDKIILFRHRF